MPTTELQQIEQYYELHGDPAAPPLLLLGGLGGVGAQWSHNLAAFASRYYVILPDQRGTGRTTHADSGYTTRQLAADMHDLLQHLQIPAVHVVGASTGAAIGQWMALDHPETVLTLTMAGGFARFDPFAHRGSDARRVFVADRTRRERFEAYVNYLFSQRYTRQHPEEVTAWIEEVLTFPESDHDRDVALQRLDMIAAHDTVDRLPEIGQPSLVLVGSHDVAAGEPLSEEIVAGVPDCEYHVFPGSGHLIEIEDRDEFFARVSSFIDEHARR